ncbi:hypothetical protein [Moorena sp. SIO1G6]|nr:hypothetical protein [Moorena sp. SIO1G6]
MGSCSQIRCSQIPTPYSLLPTPLGGVPHPIENRYNVLSCV